MAMAVLSVLEPAFLNEMEIHPPERDGTKNWTEVWPIRVEARHEKEDDAPSPPTANDFG